MVSDVATGDEWAAGVVFGPDPSARRPDVPVTRTGTGDASPPVDLDAGAEPASEANPNAGANKAAAWLGLTLMVAVAAIVTILVSFGGGDTAAASRPAAAAVAPVAPVAAPSSAPAAPDQDRAIAYTASANCPAGSTSAQSLTDAANRSAWTCVRGQQGARVDGQVLRVDLGGSHVLSAVSVTPGWVAKTPGGADEWLQHRVVTRLQYVFDDADHTIVVQDTGNAHGPVTTALPHRVLASRVTVIVLQTARPPASPPPRTDPGAPALPGFGDSLLGPFGGPPPADGSALTDPPPPEAAGEDPVDATFAISALTFIGHQPI